MLKISEPDVSSIHGRTRDQSGFTLVEVLVAVLVLSLGILGLVGLESLSLKNNTSAYQRSQATILAYDLTDRIRANLAGLSSYTGSASASSCSPCSPAQLAGNDLFEWDSRLNETLPGASHNVAINSGEVTISVTWEDNRERTSGKTETFTTTFRP